MKPWRSALAGLVSLATMLALAAPPGAWAQPVVPVVAEAATGRQILVMLRLSPDHYRPNSSYDGDYGDQQTGAARRRLAERIAHRHGLNLVGDGWPMPLVGLDCYVMAVPADRTVETVVAQVAQDPLVAWSQPVQEFKAKGGQPSGQPSLGDPLFAVQPAAKAWRLADLHRVVTGRGVVVAVVDSKIEVNHPDLAGQFVAEADFVLDRPSGPERHGTGVAGVIAAKEGNGVGIAGIAPQARLMALRACWQNEGVGAPTVCDSLSLAKAIHFAIDHNAGVINLSLAGPPDLLLQKLLEVAAARRISVVAAYDPTLPKGGFPASEPGVIAVAIDSLPSLPPGVYGAPGQDIPTTEPGGKWDLVNGSSYAAAHVSGLIALIRETHASVVRTMLVATQPMGGLVDACATILRPARVCDCSCVAGGQTAKTAR